MKKIIKCTGMRKLLLVIKLKTSINKRISIEQSQVWRPVPVGNGFSIYSFKPKLKCLIWDSMIIV